jgi:murein L,D-transpeptidase YafK
MKMYISDDIRQKFNITEKKKKFTTHKELDEFVEMLKEKDVEFEYHHKDEYNFLKAFDRGKVISIKTDKQSVLVEALQS